MANHGWSLVNVFFRKKCHIASDKLIRSFWFKYQSRAHIGSKANIWYVPPFKAFTTQQKLFEVEVWEHAEVFVYYANLGRLFNCFLFPLFLIFKLLLLHRIFSFIFHDRYILSEKQGRTPKIKFSTFLTQEVVVFSELVSTSPEIYKKTKSAIKYANIGYKMSLTARLVPLILMLLTLIFLVTNGIKSLDLPSISQEASEASHYQRLIDESRRKFNVPPSKGLFQ